MAARTQLPKGTSIVQGFWLEFFLTANLVFAVFMLAAEKHRGTFLAPVGIGLALFVGELLGTNFTGGSLNPARTLGPDVVSRQFDGYCWIYYAAPMVAAAFAAAFYNLLKWLQYETVVPDQNADETKSVVRDLYSNIIGVIDQLRAGEVHYVEANEQEAAEDATAFADPRMAQSQLGSHDHFTQPKSEHTVDSDHIHHMHAEAKPAHAI